MEARIWLVSQQTKCLEQNKKWSHQECLRKIIKKSWCSFLKHSMTYKLETPAKQLSCQNHLPCEGEAEADGEGVAAEPAEEAEDGGEGAGLLVHEQVEEGIDESADEGEVEGQRQGVASSR